MCVMADDSKIEAKFWQELAVSPFVMLGLAEARDGHTQPMTVHFKGNHGPLWFFTQLDNNIVEGLGISHRAIAAYTAKGHDLFATIHGDLSVEYDSRLIDRLWNPEIASWYQDGRNDPKLCVLRFDAERAQIWLSGSSFGAAIKQIFGRDPKADYRENVAEVVL
jgi:general stress protein 26